MLALWWISAAALILLTLSLALALRRRSNYKPTPVCLLLREKQRFRLQREHLEAKFLKLACGRLGPDVPHWADCEFDDDVAYVRSRATGELSALVAVTLTPDALADSDCQTATAVFRFDRDHWETDGRAILNLSPGEAIQFFHDDLEIVEEEIGHGV